MDIELKTILKIYLSIYILILIPYSLAEYLLFCTERAIVCQFDESKLIAFITLCTYIISPIVALYIFNGWKKQSNHNQKQEVIGKLNDGLRILSTILYRNHGLYNRICDDKKLGHNYDFSLDLEENEILRKVGNDVLSLLKELYYLTDKNKEYLLFRHKFHKYLENVSIYLKEAYRLIYEKPEQGQDRIKELADYFEEMIHISYYTDIHNEKWIKMCDVSLFKKEIFKHCYDAQNDITNYILKNDFGVEI
ncbi:hypothetical protein [Acinetobacter sp. ASP199]|uniref:hypothetical protein n=1 Tax=unclassified Acinetobacter TaxID=196816 RepID=UPI001F615371|nr:hypothetical protein [Acinetobacter sp. ASP199]UNT59920.1 hypothetical protein IHE35_03555 [Acinetobacter sp. ASP199]